MNQHASSLLTNLGIIRGRFYISNSPLLSWQGVWGEIGLSQDQRLGLMDRVSSGVYREAQTLLEKVSCLVSKGQQGISVCVLVSVFFLCVDLIFTISLSAA